MRMRPQVFLVLFASVIAGVLIFAHGIRTYNPFLQWFPVLLVAVPFALNRTGALFLGAVMISNAKLVPPGLSGDLHVFQLMLVLVAVIVWMRVIIKKEPLVMDPGLRMIAIIYACVVFYTMLVRGVGFSMLGSDQSGGMRYVKIYISVLSLLFIPNLSVKPGHLRVAIIIAAFMALLPGLAELVFILSNGKIYQQFSFIQLTMEATREYVAFSAGENFRFKSLASVGEAFILLPFFLVPFKGKSKLWYVILISLGLVAVALSGYRSRIITGGLFLFLFGLYWHRSSWVAYLGKWLTAGILCYILAFLTYDYLPFPAQRAISFLPYVASEGSEAARDAAGTANWRLEVWRRGIQQIPDYLVLGKGMTFDQAELDAISAAHWMGEERIFLVGSITNFHNGPIEALVYLGIPGFISLFIFFFLAFRRSWDLVKKLNPGSVVHRLCLVYFLQMLSSIILFMISFGSPHGTFAKVCFYASIIFLLYSTDRRGRSEKVPEQAAPDGKTAGDIRAGAFTGSTRQR